MEDKCQLIRGVLHGHGHKVSRSNVKTKRMFKVNLHEARLYSYAFKVYVGVKIRNRTLRTIDKYGGLDAFLTGYRKSKLTDYALRLRKKVLKHKVVANDAAAGVSQ